jgi:hypothetical protein
MAVASGVGRGSARTVTWQPPGARPGACEVVLPAGDAEGNVVVQMQRAVSAKHVKSWGAIFHANVLKTLAAALRRPECAALSLFFPPIAEGGARQNPRQKPIGLPFC